MTHIAFVMPDPALVKVVDEAWTLHNRLFGKNPDLSYTVDSELQPEVIMSRHFNADVIVSRGGTAASLKKCNCLIPVVEIPITGSDIIMSIRKAFERYGERPIGVVGTVNTIRGVHFMQSPFSVPIKSYTTASINLCDLVNGMERAVTDGCEIILAGHNTCRFCDERGIPAGLILSSVESSFSPLPRPSAVQTSRRSSGKTA